MIFQDPPDDVLRQADVIAVFDPAVPSWHEIVIALDESRSTGVRDFLVVDIPVDSRDTEATNALREHIRNVRMSTQRREKWGCRDSNPEPRNYEFPALTD